MPIDIETFEEHSDEHLGGGPSQPERVLSFLAMNGNRAFRPREIAEAINIPYNSIHSVLKRLEDRDLVRHKGTYWAITDDRERLHSLSQYQLVTEGMNELYGNEDPSEWVEQQLKGGETTDAEDA
jgi:predicted transcriptional regulator